MKNPIYLGIDCGATTSKIGAIDSSGQCISKQLRQSPTHGDLGVPAIIAGWMDSAHQFLADHSLSWDHVAGVGLAIPGPYLGYGVLGPMPNLPTNLTGWHFLDDLTTAVASVAARNIPVATANDGQLAGIAEAQLLQLESPGSVLMLAPGSGLGCSFVNANGSALSGDHQTAAILSHMPAPYEVLDLPRFKCGCGRDWGCFEAYTSISGLAQYIRHLLPSFKNHEFAQPDCDLGKQVLSLRSRAQNGDPLALTIFDLQAKAMGHAVATACMAYDPSHVIIGGGLIDPDATSPEFRNRYLQGIIKSASKYLWTDQSSINYRTAALGELAQAIGAAMMIMRQVQN